MSEGGKFDIFTPINTQGMWGKISRKNKWIISGFIVIVVGLGGYLVVGRFANRTVVDTARAPISEPPSQPTTTLKTETAPIIESAPLFGDANYQSENFRVGDIAIGGEAEFLLTEDTPEPIEITSIRGEAFTEKNKQEVKLVVFWKTNKLAKSEISYSKGVGQAQKTVSEDDYSLNHSLIIPGLDQASTYVYAITSQDRFGNEITSEQHAVYTGSRTVSLFDLIADAVGEVFGWAVNKK